MDDRILLAVAGAHLEGEPLNHELTDRGGALVAPTRTEACYRMYALATDPPKPGLERVPANAAGASLEVEVWAVDPVAFATFVDGVRPPLVIGRVRLVDGTDVAGFLCEPIGLEGAVDITAFRGWRAYRAHAAQP